MHTDLTTSKVLATALDYKLNVFINRIKFMCPVLYSHCQSCALSWSSFPTDI